MITTEVLTPPSTASEQEFQTAAFLFTTIENQITRADTKAGLVVAADSVFATSILLISRGILLELFNPAAPFVARLASVAMFAVFFVVLCSTTFALVAARPTLKVRKEEDTLFFFGRISQLEHNEFIEHFSRQDVGEMRRAILTEIHNTSQIATRKFARIRYSLDFLVAAVILWAVVELLISLSPL